MSRLRDLFKLLDQQSAPGGSGGSSVLALAQNSGPTALGAPDAVSGYPPVLDAAAFTLTETTLVLPGAGGRIDPSYVEGGQRPVIMAHLCYVADQDSNLAIGPWALTLNYPEGSGGAVDYQWTNPQTGDPYSPIVLGPGAYMLALRAGLAAEDSNAATGLDMKAWAVKLG